MLNQRVITSVILAPLAVAGIIFLPPPAFAVAALVIILLGAWEWAELSGFSTLVKVAYLGVITVVCWFLSGAGHQVQLWVLYSSLVFWALLFCGVVGYPGSTKYWAPSWSRGLIGCLILVSAWVSLSLLKSEQVNGLLILLLIAIIWSADIGAYCSGKAFGRVKLAPKVSPGKTWEGVYGGLLASLVACWLFASLFGVMQPGLVEDWLNFAVLALVTVAVSILGDLTESMVKRYRGVKDSGRLLPGHGGMMDRIDSMVAGLPFYTLILLNLGRG